MTDIFAALRAYLAGVPAVATLSDRIFVNRIPVSTIEDADTFHPPKMVVIRQAGGRAKADDINLDFPAVTILAYGETDFEADTLRRAVETALLAIDRTIVGDTILHGAVSTGGAVPSVDPDIVWPAVSQGFAVMASAST